MLGGRAGWGATISILAAVSGDGGSVLTPAILGGIRTVAVLIAVAVASQIGAIGNAGAQQTIGKAETARNDVRREIGAAAGPLNPGETVFRDEIVLTGTDSTSKLVFLDSTNLAVGPTSRVVLDRFVYDPNPSSQTMAVSMAKGVFRFTTGVMNKGAYTLTTPTAAIGVRGTVLDIAVEGAHTRVTLREGEAIVCPRRKDITFAQQVRNCSPPDPAIKISQPRRKCDCVKLKQNGETADVSRGGGSIHAGFTDADVQFASLCAGDSSLCSDDAYAGGASPALCGR